ncbi:murein hydrolase activator EnvC family protein [Eubacteriales bacterium KG127]
MKMGNNQFDMLRQKKLRHVAVSVTALMIILSMVLGPVIIQSVEAVSIEDQQKELNQINEQKSNAEKDEKNVVEKIRQKAGEVENLEKNIAEQNEKINSTRVEMDKKRAELLVKKERLETRLRAIYKKGSVGFVEVILSSNNVSELISNITFMQKIYKGDKVAINSVKQDQAQLAAIESKLKNEEEVLVAKKTESEKAKEELEQERSKIKKQIDDLQAQSASIGAQIAQAQAELEAKRRESSSESNQGSNNGGGGSSSYPVGTGRLGWPARGPVTSEFGYRPIFGDFHTGIDIGLPNNAPIYAADSGVVINVASTSWGYGNYVVIDHGGGISTLYAHNNSIAVSVGQSVSKGQVIAYAGSTGWSTGTHCHFEVRVNGSAVNPRGYL